MKNLKIENNDWSNLPRDVIINVLQYLNEYFRPSSRLINKHWSFCTNPLLFYSIKKFEKSSLDFVINNYSKFIRFLDNNGAESTDIIMRICRKVNKIEGLRWWSGTEECLTGLIDLLIRCNQITSIILTDCEYDDDEDGHKLNWDLLVDVMAKHSSLQALDISIRCTYLLPLFNSLPGTSINKLILTLDSSQIESSLKIINNTKQLKWLEITATNPEFPDEFPDTSALVNPSELLLDNNLEHLKIWIYYYYYLETSSFKTYFINELLSIFSNTNFLRLKSFDWHFWFPSYTLEDVLFNEPITLKLPQWTKLTKLSLFTIDKYLMSYIIEQCPNLRELSFNSPFVLPHDHSSSKLVPLKHLTRLLFGGFKVELSDYFEVINVLFPSVVTLSLYDTNLLSDDIVMDAYYIPLLFPSLRYVIFETEDYKLNNLINNFKEGELNWEELYISLDGTNQALLKPLVKILGNLKVLYLFSSVMEINLDKLDLEPSSLKIFSASISNIMGFNIRISSELKVKKETKSIKKRFSV